MTELSLSSVGSLEEEEDIHLLFYPGPSFLLTYCCCPRPPFKRDRPPCDTTKSNIFYRIFLVKRSCHILQLSVNVRRRQEDNTHTQIVRKIAIERGLLKGPAVEAKPE